MADICMCTGNCPIKEYCYRYMAEYDPYWQTFSSLESVCIPNDYSELIPYKKGIQKEDEKKISYTLENFIMDEILKNMSETN